MELDLWVDTIKENHFIPRNAAYFDKLCRRFAIHYGWNDVPSSWATEIGLTCSDIARYQLKGIPNWKPNALLVDLGRCNGMRCLNRIEMPSVKALKVLYSADEHRHHYTPKQGVDVDYFRYAALFDYVMLRQKSVLPLYDAKKTFWFPHSAQIECIPKERIKPTHDLVFVSASMTPERKEMLAKLKGFNMLFVEGGLNEYEYFKTISLGRISLNKTQTDCEMNKRIFEVMASGSLLITNYTKGAGLEDLFENGKHLRIYSTEREMIQLIKYYIAHETERAKIVENGRREVMAHHTSDKRTEQIIKFLKDRV
jgi:hypothetical protein